MSIPRFVLSFIIFTVLLAALPAAIHFSSYAYLLVNKFNVMFFFFSVLTFIVSIAVIIATKKDHSLSAQVFLIATAVKLLMCMGFALAYLHQNHQSPGHFLACFFYLYLLNTVFEVYSLLVNLRN